MSELPRIVRARLGAETAGAHPDADMLTAFREKALLERERRMVVAHLAQCAECREVMAMAIPPAESMNAGTVLRERSSWLQAPWVRWASLVACLVVVGAAVLIHPKPQATGVHPSSETEAVSLPPAAHSAEKVEGGPLPTEPAQTAAREPFAPSPRSNRAVISPGVGARVANAPAQARTEEKTEGVSRKVAVVNGAGTLRDQSSPEVSRSLTAGSTGGVLKQGGVPAAAPSRRQDEVAPLTTTVEVNGASTAVNVADSALAKNEELPGRAKPAAPSARGVPAENALQSSEREAAKKELVDAYANQFSTAPAQWMLSREGQLQHSLDAGSTWQPVPVVERAKFTALSVKGQDIWVGGASGLLYHSADGGTHWTQVKPAADGLVLSADITQLSFVDLQHGTLTTSDNQTWTTADGGKSWQKHP